MQKIEPRLTLISNTIREVAATAAVEASAYWVANLW